jgi:nicotinamidase-related amidase
MEPFMEPFRLESGAQKVRNGLIRRGPSSPRRCVQAAAPERAETKKGCGDSVGILPGMRLPTLLVIDVQRAFDDPAWEERNNPDAEQHVRGLLAAWRAAGAPVVHVRHESASPEGLFRRGTAAFEFKPEAEPLPGEPVVDKRVNSAFIGTDLEERLHAAGAETVVVAGLTTDHCCSTTARMAGNLGFETWFVADATATHARGDFDAETMHQTALASLDGEFARVMTAAEAIERLHQIASREHGELVPSQS